MNVVFPKRGRGRQSAEKKAKYEREVEAFCDAIVQIASRLDFSVSSRGWCYVLEDVGGVTKGDFDSAQRLINDCRKSGMLPMDICNEDIHRSFDCLERLDEPHADGFASSWVWAVKNAYMNYAPISFWDDKDVYIQMLVEKTDLKSLFLPECERYHVPLANQGGWADLWTRYRIAERFAKHEAAGRQCVLLYCGDFDPGGLAISDGLRKTLADMSMATGWSPNHLEIERFGLNYDFIMENGLTWIDNLETGSGGRLDDPGHRMHNAPYVQEYIERYGVRKVEANALVVRPEQGRQLAHDAIVKWIGDEDAPERYEERLNPYRQQARKAISELLAA